MVDSADSARLDDCRAELHSILKEERLFGATLLIFANKQDIPSALSREQIEEVCGRIFALLSLSELLEDTIEFVRSGCFIARARTACLISRACVTMSFRDRPHWLCLMQALHLKALSAT